MKDKIYIQILVGGQQILVRGSKIWSEGRQILGRGKIVPVSKLFCLKGLVGLIYSTQDLPDYCLFFINSDNVCIISDFKKGFLLMLASTGPPM